MWRFRKPEKRREVRELIKSYNEGLRLMRVGDGRDEWAGNHIAYEARERLRSLGYDIDGTRPDLTSIDRRA